MSESNSSSQSGTLRLVALGVASPQVQELRTRRITIGTAAGNDLILNEPTASRRHAALERRWGGWRVVDLGSTNGTYLNGRRVTSPTPLARGDELRFGNARFGFVAPGDDPFRVVAGSVQVAARSRRRVPRVASAALAALLLAGGGFAVTAYLLNFNRLDRAAGGVAERDAATPPAAANAASALSAAATSAAVGGSAGSTGVATPTAGSATEAGAPGAAASAPEPQWLAHLNAYRAMAKLAPVSDEPSLSEGELSHTRYLVENYAGPISHGVNIGVGMHEEETGKPGFTRIGLHAAQNSDVAEWPGPTPPSSPNWALDDWMTGAFHRINILNPRLRQVAYGQSCGDFGVCTAALNVLGGAERSEYSLPLATPILFPPPGSTVGLGPLHGEWPDPTSSCSGYGTPAGLPITLQLGAMVDARLDGYRLIRDGASPVNLEACGFDASSYNNPDATAQERGREILHGFGAAVVVPRVPLDKGASYMVSVTVNGREYKWRFSTSP